jgi:hypothetical protein
LDIVEITTSCAVCVCFKCWLRVYYGLDLLLIKLSIAQSSGKFRERHTMHCASAPITPIACVHCVSELIPKPCISGPVPLLCIKHWGLHCASGPIPCIVQWAGCLYRALCIRADTSTMHCASGSILLPCMVRRGRYLYSALCIGTNTYTVHCASRPIPIPCIVRWGQYLHRTRSLPPASPQKAALAFLHIVMALRGLSLHASKKLREKNSTSRYVL